MGKSNGTSAVTLDEWVRTVAERKPRLTYGYIRDEHPAGRFLDTIQRCIHYDHRNSRFLLPGGEFAGLQSGPRVAEGRSQLVDEYLSSPQYARSTHFLMLDADMVLPDNLFEILVRTATANSIPILGALCFVGGIGRHQFPTIFRAYNEDDGHLAVEPVEEYPDNALVKVGATGAACTLIRRDVFTRMLEKFGRLANGEPNPYPWYAEGLTTSTGKPLGEDIAFCRKAMLLGLDIYVHTGIKLGHVKAAEMDESTYLDWRAKLPTVETTGAAT